MNRRLKQVLVLGSVGLALSKAVLAADLFSHAVINLPAEVIADQPWAQMIENAEAWHVFYRSVAPGAGQSQNAAVPEIDFTHHRVLAGGLGIRPSGGHQLVIESVRELEAMIYVSAISMSPGVGCGATGNLTYPTVAILLKKSAKPISFSLITTSRNCR